MKVVEIKVLRGPNYWSVRRPKLIQMKLDLEELEQQPTNKIEGFRQRLQDLLPSLYEHRCSEGVPGGAATPGAFQRAAGWCEAAGTAREYTL